MTAPKCPVLVEKGRCGICFKEIHLWNFGWVKAWYHKYIEDDRDHCPIVEIVAQ